MSSLENENTLIMSETFEMEILLSKQYYFLVNRCVVISASLFVVAELSEVLWDMVLHLALGMKGGLGVIAAFALFAFWAGKFLVSFPFPFSEVSKFSWS